MEESTRGNSSLGGSDHMCETSNLQGTLTCNSMEESVDSSTPMSNDLSMVRSSSVGNWGWVQL